MSETMHPILIPAADEDAVKPWRKLLRGLDEQQPGGKAITGDWIEPGATVELPGGTLIVGCDRTQDGHRVRVWRVTRDGTLRVERDSTFVAYKSAFGRSVRTTLRTALAKHPCPLPAGQAPRVLSEPRRLNQRAGTCQHCGHLVEARAGTLDGHGANTRVRHHPACPPPPPPPPPTPRRNSKPGACQRCGGWIECGAGLLHRDIGGWQVRHDGDCPPPEQREPAPLLRNTRASRCATCWQTIPAGTGVIRSNTMGIRWSEHDGACPPYPDGYTGPTWTTGEGIPGRHRGGPPPSPLPLGKRMRVTINPDPPVPDTAPGYHTTTTGLASFIAVVVAAATPEYCRDDDGDQPSALIGQDGWYYGVRIRPASAEEAADILAAESAARRRRRLHDRARSAFFRSEDTDAEWPDESNIDLTGCEEIPFGAHRGWYNPLPTDKLYASQDWVWALRYNGADGDDWRRNNYGGYIATRRPMTSEYAELIAALRTEFGPQPPETADE